VTLPSKFEQISNSVLSKYIVLLYAVYPYVTAYALKVKFATSPIRWRMSKN